MDISFLDPSSLSGRVSLPGQVPFYNREGGGVYIADTQMHWVSLRKSGSRLSVQGVWTVKVGEDREQALSELAKRADPGSSVVASHLDPSAVRMRKADRTGTRSEREWALQKAEELVPEGLSIDSFVARWYPLEPVPEVFTPDARVPYVVAIARETAIERRLELFEAAGLSLIALSDLRMDLGLAYSRDEAFKMGASPILLAHGDREWLLRHENGFLSELPESVEASPPHGMREAGRLLKESGAKEGGGAASGTSAPEEVRVAGSSAGRIITYAREERSQEPSPEELVIGDSPSFGEEKSGLSPEFLPPLALGVLRLYPETSALNFLDLGRVQALKDEQDREDAVQVALGAFGVVGGVLLITVLLGAVLQWQRTQTTAKLEGLRSRLAAVEEAEQVRDTLRSRLRVSKRLMQEQTRASLLLAQVGQAVPPELWLQSITLGRTEASVLKKTDGPQENRLQEADGRQEAGQAQGLARGQMRALVNGYGLKREGVETFLTALENTSSIEGVSLVRERLLRPEAVEQRISSEIRSQRMGAQGRQEAGGRSIGKPDPSIYRRELTLFEVSMTHVSGQ